MSKKKASRELPRLRRSVWRAQLDPTMRFAPGAATPVLVTHEADGPIFVFLGETSRGDDLRLGDGEQAWRVIGAASLVYVELAGEGPSPLIDDYTVYERRLYVFESSATKPVLL